MNINHNFFNLIKPILQKVKKELGNDFVVFGSAPLYLLGLVKKETINDIDIAVKNANCIPSQAKEVFFQEDPNQKLYKLEINGVEVDIGTCWPGQENDFSELFEEPIVVEGFKFVNLQTTKKWKEKMIKKYGR